MKHLKKTRNIELQNQIRMIQLQSFYLNRKKYKYGFQLDLNPFIHDEHIIVDSEKAKKNLQFYLKHENERNHNLILNYKNKIYIRDFKQIKTIDKKNPIILKVLY